MIGSFERKTPEFVARPLEQPLRYANYPDPIAARIGLLLAEYTPVVEFAARHGLRVLENDSDTHVWDVVNVRGEYMGRLTRDETKRVRTWRERPGPWYATFRPTGENLAPGLVVIVEDALSAALLAEDGITAIALLGTNLSLEAAQEIAAHDRGMTYVVLLDPDAAGMDATLKVAERLRTAGARAHSGIIDKDVKDMPLEERHDLINDLVAGW
jgi:hypothetical protein